MAIYAAFHIHPTLMFSMLFIFWKGQQLTDKICITYSVLVTCPTVLLAAAVRMFCYRCQY